MNNIQIWVLNIVIKIIIIGKFIVINIYGVIIVWIVVVCICFVNRVKVVGNLIVGLEIRDVEFESQCIIFIKNIGIV